MRVKRVPKEEIFRDLETLFKQLEPWNELDRKRVNELRRKYGLVPIFAWLGEEEEPTTKNNEP